MAGGRAFDDEDDWPRGSAPEDDPGRPVGALRSPALQIFLAIITLGIWCLVWSYMTADELKRYL